MMLLTVTFFENYAAKTKREECLPPAALIELIQSTTAPTKQDLPWLKLARFGDQPSKTGSQSLRHNANVSAVTGLEGDYDGEQVAIEQVVDILREAGIEAIVYPSPSYTTTKPRWRVLCPFSRELPPTDRDRMMDRLEGMLCNALGLPAVFGRESWVLSQSYYFGTVANGNVPPSPVHVQGTPIDLHDTLDDAAKRPRSNGSDQRNGRASPPQAPIEDIAAALEAIPNPYPDWDATGNWEEWNKIGMAVWRASAASEEGFALFDQWSAKWSEKYDPDDTRFRWDHYHRSPPDQLGAGTLFRLAAEFQPGWLSPAQCEIKRLAALPPVQYMRERKAAAKRLELGVAELDRLVKATHDEAHDNHTSRRQADLLVRARGVDLFLSGDDVVYADIRINGYRETWPVRSTQFTRWLNGRYFEATKKAASQNAVQSALGTIEARAQAAAVVRPVHLRVGEHEGKIYIDLTDEEWRAVEIDAGGWRVVDEPPIRFRREKGMLPLPDPTQGGSVHDLRPFLNVQTEDGFILLVTWITAALRGRGPYPLIEISGEGGTARSTLARVMRSLIDPSTVPLQAPPKDERDVFIGTGNSYLTVYDNVSHLQDWLSDALCRLSTGGGYRTRQLYTDREETLFDAMCPVIVVAIDNVVVRGDLADREIRLRLKPILKSERRLESEFWASFKEVRPAILGALCDAVSHGLRRLPTVQLDELPRMADFATWGVACEGALWDEGAFMASYTTNVEEVVGDIIERDEVARVVCSFMERRSEWFGSATMLLEELTVHLSDAGSTPSKTWPKAPHALTRRLRQVAPALRKGGMDVRDGRSAKGRRITITRVEDEPYARAQPAAPLDPNGSPGGRGEGPPAETSSAPQSPIGSGDDANDAPMTLSAADSVTANPEEICGETGADDANDAISSSVMEEREIEEISGGEQGPVEDADMCFGEKEKTGENSVIAVTQSLSSKINGEGMTPAPPPTLQRRHGRRPPGPIINRETKYHRGPDGHWCAADEHDETQSEDKP
jgi:hypothetical protein